LPFITTDRAGRGWIGVVEVRLPVSGDELAQTLLDVLGSLAASDDRLHEWIRDTMGELQARLRAEEVVRAEELVDGNGWEPRVTAVARASSPLQLAGAALLVRLAREFRLGGTEAALAAALHDPGWRERILRVLRSHHLPLRVDLPGDLPLYLHDHPGLLIDRARGLAEELDCPILRDLLRRWKWGDPDAYPEILRLLAECADVLPGDPYRPLLERLAERYRVDPDLIDGFARLLDSNDLPDPLRWEHRVLRANAAAVPGPTPDRRPYLPWVRREHGTAYTDLRRLVPPLPRGLRRHHERPRVPADPERGRGAPHRLPPRPGRAPSPRTCAPGTSRPAAPGPTSSTTRSTTSYPSPPDPLTTLTEEELHELREALPHPEPALAQSLPLTGLIRVKSWLLHRKLPGRMDLERLHPGRAT
jgi:hypothetical protein